MKIEIIREFLTIVKCRSYTKAAKELFLSQPSLSAHISAMEKDLGFLVFERGANKLVLTSAGLEFLEHAQTIACAYEDALDIGRSLAKKQPPIRVHIGARNSELFLRLSELDEPKIVFVDIDFNTTLIMALTENLIDVCFPPDYTIDKQLTERALSANVAFERTSDARATIAVADSHPLAKNTSLTKKDLDGVTVSIGRYAYYDEWKQTVANMLGEEVRLKFRMNPVESASELARADLRNVIHICDAHASRQYFAHRNDIVFFRQIDGKHLCYPAGIAYRSNCQNSQIGEFVKKVKEIMEDIEH